jgi:hypothetical protein
VPIIAPSWSDTASVESTGNLAQGSRTGFLNRLDPGLQISRKFIRYMHLRIAPDCASAGLIYGISLLAAGRNRGMSEMCQYRPKGLARSTYWREKIDSGGNAHSGSHARRSASIFREAGAR